MYPLCVCAHACRFPQKPKEGVRSPETGIACSCESLDVGAGPLQERQAIWTVELSPTPMLSIIDSTHLFTSVMVGGGWALLDQDTDWVRETWGGSRANECTPENLDLTWGPGQGQRLGLHLLVHFLSPEPSNGPALALGTQE